MHKVIHETIHLLGGIRPPIGYFFLFRVTILVVWGCDEETVYATIATDKLKHRQIQLQRIWLEQVPIYDD